MICERRLAATRWPSREIVGDRSQGVQLAVSTGGLPLLGERVRPRSGRGEAERAAAVHYRDRWCGDPLSPRAIPTRGCIAADHDARLARFGHRDARLHRSAHGSDHVRRDGRGCVSPRAAVAARLWLLGRAGRGRLGPRPHRTGVGRADAPSRLHRLRGAGRRRRCRRHGCNGAPGTRGAARYPYQLARARAERPRRPAVGH